jgi:hypothetical protein
MDRSSVGIPYNAQAYATTTRASGGKMTASRPSSLPAPVPGARSPPVLLGAEDHLINQSETITGADYEQQTDKEGDGRAAIYARLMCEEHHEAHGGSFVMGRAVGIFSNMGDGQDTSAIVKHYRVLLNLPEDAEKWPFNPDHFSAPAFEARPEGMAESMSGLLKRDVQADDEEHDE